MADEARLYGSREVSRWSGWAVSWSSAPVARAGGALGWAGWFGRKALFAIGQETGEVDQRILRDSAFREAEEDDMRSGGRGQSAVRSAVQPLCVARL
jgi:hypothetical protein